MGHDRGGVRLGSRRGRTSIVGLVGLILTLVGATVVVAGAPAVSAAPQDGVPPQAGVSTEYPLAAGDLPRGITVGPDGALWFANSGSGSIGRVTTDGTFSTFTGVGLDRPESVTTGPDGALWFTDRGSRSIGRITTAGAVTTFSDPGIIEPWSIVSGPDGALWFTDPVANRIGRITTAGVMSFFADGNIRHPLGITVDTIDGSLWFTNHELVGSIGRIDVDGNTWTAAPATPMLNPTGITFGPDGAIWFVISEGCCEGPTGQIGRYASGAFEMFPETRGAVAPFYFPNALAFGADGALYFPNYGYFGMGRLSMHGTFSELDVVARTSTSTQSVASGPDGRVWYTTGRSIAAANVLGVSTAPTAAVANAAFTSAVVEWAEPAVPGTTNLGYTVTASPGGATCQSTITTCSVTGLVPGAAYTFSVVATNEYGTSAPSVSAPVTTGLEPFVATPSGSPNVTTAQSPDGRVELFARDPAGGLIHRWQLSPNGPWSEWQWMGVFISGTPAVAPSEDGRLELWATDQAGGLIHSWQLEPNGVWSSWQWTGVFTQGSPSAAAAPDGRLEIFALDPNGGLIHSWQLVPNGVWSAWRWTGVFAQGAPGLQAHAGRLEMFATDPSGGLIHSWQLEANGPWSDWQWMGVFVADTPTVTADAAGRLRVYAVGLDGTLTRLAQHDPDGVFFADPLPPVLSNLRLQTSPAASLGADGRENLLALDAQGVIVHAWLGRDWTWRSAVLQGAEAKGPVAVFAEADERLSVLVTDLYDGLITTRQVGTTTPIFEPWRWTGVFVT